MLGSESGAGDQRQWPRSQIREMDIDKSCMASLVDMTVTEAPQHVPRRPQRQSQLSFSEQRTDLGFDVILSRDQSRKCKTIFLKAMARKDEAETDCLQGMIPRDWALVEHVIVTEHENVTEHKGK